MVRHIGKRGLKGRNPVADRRAGMTDQHGRDVELADVKVSTRHLMQDKLTRQFAQPYRKERRREVTHKAVPEMQCRTSWSPEVHLNFRIVQRREESQSLDVIHVQMRKQDIYPT